jgi:hypothetical protein
VPWRNAGVGRREQRLLGGCSLFICSLPVDNRFGGSFLPLATADTKTIFCGSFGGNNAYMSSTSSRGTRRPTERRRGWAMINSGPPIGGRRARARLALPASATLPGPGEWAERAAARRGTTYQSETDSHTRDPAAWDAFARKLVWTRLERGAHASPRCYPAGPPGAGPAGSSLSAAYRLQVSQPQNCQPYGGKREEALSNISTQNVDPRSVRWESEQRMTFDVRGNATARPAAIAAAHGHAWNPMLVSKVCVARWRRSP